MTRDFESVMKAALDGKFFSFTHSDAGGTRVVETAVTENYRHEYKTISQTESGLRGGMARALQNLASRAIFWTDEKIQELTKLRAQNHGARVMGRMLGTSRTEVGIQLNKMGILSTIGQPYNSRPQLGNQRHEAGKS